MSFPINTRRFFNAWWHDDRGSIDAASYVFLVTVLGIGAIAGLSTFRDQVVQGLGDIALALDNVNQSYSVTIGTVTSVYVDSVSGNAVAGTAPEGISLTVGATAEN